MVIGFLAEKFRDKFEKESLSLISDLFSTKFVIYRRVRLILRELALIIRLLSRSGFSSRVNHLADLIQLVFCQLGSVLKCGAEKFSTRKLLNRWRRATS